MRKLKTVAGWSGYRKVTLKVFPPLGEKMRSVTHRAQPGRCYIPEEIEQMTDDLAEHLDKNFPDMEFRMVEVAPNAFNFVYAGKRERATYGETARS